MKMGKMKIQAVPNYYLSCSTPGCNRPIEAHGLCHTCYMRMRRQQAKEKPVNIPLVNDENFSIGSIGINENALYESIIKNALENLAKENQIDLATWIEKKITLPPGNGYNGISKMNFNLFPHMKQILKLVDNPDCKKIVLCFAAQSGKSDTLASIAAYLTGYRNRRGLFVLPTSRLLEKVRETRLLPLFKNSDVNFKDIKDKMIFNFSNNFFSLALASSSGTMAEQTSTSWVIIDEHDEYNLESPRAEDPIKLSERRMQASKRKLLLLACTPKKTGQGYTYDHYKRSKKFIEEIQCPLCNGWFVPDFYKCFKWPHVTEYTDLNEIEIHSLAWVECPNCKGKITDAMHLDIVTNRKRWKDLDPDLTLAECGFRLPSYLTPNKNFSSTVCEYLKVKEIPMELADFNNSVLAHPIEFAAGKAGKDIDYSKLLGDYYIEKLEIPEDVFALTAGADVGKDFIWFTLVGWATWNRKFIIRSEKVARGKGVEGFKIAMDKITDICNIEYRHKGKYKPCFFGGLVDSGYDTTLVYDYCLHSKFWDCAKGIAYQKQPIVISSVDKNEKHSIYHGLTLVLLNTDMLHSDLHEYLNTPPGERHGITFAADAPKVLFEHLAAQEQHEINAKYKSVFRWGKAKNRADHLRDALLHALALGIYKKFNIIERVE